MFVIVRRSCRGCGGFVAVGVVVGAQDRAAADLHLPGQPVETLPSLPSPVDVGCDLPILRHERLAGLATLAATAIAPARWPPSRAAKVESVPNDLRPDAERPRDQVDARSSLGHGDDLRQHHLIFRRVTQRNHDIAAAARRLTEHYPTVGIQELPKADRWIIGPYPLSAVERGEGRDTVDRELGDHL